MFQFLVENWAEEDVGGQAFTSDARRNVVFATVVVARLDQRSADLLD